MATMASKVVDFLNRLAELIITPTMLPRTLVQQIFSHQTFPKHLRTLSIVSMMRKIQGRLDLLQTAKTGNLKIILLIMIEEEIFIQMGSLKTGSLKKPITAVGIRRKLNRQQMLQHQQQYKINDILRGCIRLAQKIVKFHTIFAMF